MQTLGAELLSVEPGVVVIGLPFADHLTQHTGSLHAGITTTVLDSACGYAALTQMPDDRDVLSVEFKINLLAPALGAYFRARGEVVRAGRTLTVCRGEVTTEFEGKIRTVALMQATMMALPIKVDP